MSDHQEDASIGETEPVEVVYTLTSSEYSAGARMLTFRHPVVLVTLGILGIIAAGEFSLTLSGHHLSSSSSVALALVTLGLFYMLALRPRVTYRRLRRATTEQRHIFSDEGVESWVADAEIRQRWTYFPHAAEGRWLYMLTTETGSATFVPKRAFQPGSEARFRALLGRHTKANLRPMTRSS